MDGGSAEAMGAWTGDAEMNTQIGLQAEAADVLLHATMYKDHPAESQMLIDALKEARRT